MEIALWEKVLAAGIALALLFFLGPRLKRSVENSPKAGKGDWQAVILPVACVVGFVVFLIMLVL